MTDEEREHDEWRRHATPAQRFAIAEMMSRLIRGRDKIEERPAMTPTMPGEMGE